MKTIQCIATGLLMVMSAASVGEEQSHNAPLGANERAAVQAIGASVIDAIRLEKRPEEYEAITEQVHAVKRQIDRMVIPSGSTLTLQSPNVQTTASTANTKSVAVGPSEKAAMTTLSNEIKKLKDMTRHLKPHNGEADSVWRQLTKLFDDTTAPKQGTSIIKPITPAVFRSLDSLEEDMGTALALPPEERVKAIQRLSKRFTLGKQPTPITPIETPETAPAFAESKAEMFPATPTFQTRTQHRRTFKLNP